MSENYETSERDLKEFQKKKLIMFTGSKKGGTWGFFIG